MASKPRKRKRSGNRRSNSMPSRMWPWYLLGATMVGVIAARENLPAVADWLEPASPIHGIETARVIKTTANKPQALSPPRPEQRPIPTRASLASPATGKVTFFYCGIKQDNCIVDGGSFIYHGAQIRMADIYVPATKEAKCDRERLLGGDAKEALRVLLNAGPFELATWRPIDEDQYGRKLRVVRRNGRSIGDALVAKGLARPSAGQRENWCG